MVDPLTAVAADVSNGATYVAEAFHPRGCYTRDRTTTEGDSLSASGHDEEDDDEGFAGTNIDDEAILSPPLEQIENPWFELIPIDQLPSEADVLEYDIKLLHKAHHADPFSILGPHFFRLPKDELFSIVIR